MSDDRRRSVRGFLEAALTGGEPRAQDYEDAGLAGDINRAARKWVGLIRRTARPGGGSFEGQRARQLADEGADALAAALPDEWEPPKEDPTALADKVKEVTI